MAKKNDNRGGGYTPPTTDTFRNFLRNITGTVDVLNPANYGATRSRGETLATGPAGGVGGVGGGRGGRGGRSPADMYAQALQTMLTSGSYGQSADALLQSQTQANTELSNLLNTIGTQSEGRINSSAAALQSMLQGQQNPYANFQAQAAQATPQLQQLLAAQGAETDPLAQFVAATNMANQAQAGAFQNVAGTAGNAWQQAQQQMLGDVESQRLVDLQNLANAQNAQRVGLQQQLAGYQQQAASSKEQSRLQLMQMLLQAMQSGARVRGRLF